MSRELKTCPNVVFCLFVFLFVFLCGLMQSRGMHKEYVCM